MAHRPTVVLECPFADSCRTAAGADVIRQRRVEALSIYCKATLWSSRAFLDFEREPMGRLEDAFASLSFFSCLRIWLVEENVNLSAEFISANCFGAIVLNAVSCLFYGRACTARPPLTFIYCVVLGDVVGTV